MLLSDMQVDSFIGSGYLVLENWVTKKECDQLKVRMDEILEHFSKEEQKHRSVFSTISKDHHSDQYFLDSATKISLFYEKEALSKDGELTYPLSQSINKVGHALHELDPVFKNFSSQEKILGLCKRLADFTVPYCIQSMYIFKQANIGGEVVCHQDSTFIHTRSGKLIGMWVALEDANQHNGCLWGIPGIYKGEPRSRLLRNGNKLHTEYNDKSPFDLQNLTPIEVKKGSMVVFNGLFPHLSYENRSMDSRHAYTMHWINGKEDLSPGNWIS